jgi:hypothetical protein
MPDVQPDELPGAPPEPAPAVVQPAPADDGIAGQYRAMLHAEELARQQPSQPQTLGEAIDADPNLTAPERQFLKEYPHLLNDPRALMFYANQAQSRGIARDSPRFFQHILDGFQREYARGVENAQHMAIMLARPGAAAEAGRAQAEQIIEKAQAMAPDVQIPRAETAPAMAPPSQAPRRSIPYSAPVHRDVPSASGNRDAYVDTRLTAEERDVARRSFTANDMTDAQKEYLYWLNREKLRRMRASGEYRQTTEQTG